MNKAALEIQPNLIRLALGIPTSAAGGLIGYLTAPKAHRWEGAARGAGMGYMAGSGAGIGTVLADAAAPNDYTTSQKLPYTLTGGLTGGLLGLGVGKMMQGPAAWEQRRKFREDLLSALKDEQAKFRSELKEQSPVPVLQEIGRGEKKALNPILKTLIEAKQLSDRGEYRGKHQRLRQLIDQRPDDFFIDSVNGNIAGVTHRPTGFKIHAPIKVLPANMRGFSDVAAPAVA